MTPFEKSDTRTLVALFRTALADVPRSHTPAGAVAVLADLSALLRDEGPSGGYLRQCVEDHGPQIILHALAQAYADPHQPLVYYVECP